MKTKTLLIIYILYFFLLLFWQYKADKVSGTSLLHFIDVGQGDAILITTSGNHKVLIDGGGNNQADSYIGKLFPLRPCYIDVVIVTHPHDDHLLGIERLLKRCKAGAYYNGDIYRGNVLRLGDMSLYILWPPEGYAPKDINDQSTVVLLDRGNFEALLTGDISSGILSLLDKEFIRSKTQGSFDVFKVPHHGSRGSINSVFLEYLQPEVGVIPVGRSNLFKHPHPDYLDLMSTLDVRVLRTDTDGTVVIEVK